MCGIVGVVAFNQLDDVKAENIRQDSMIYFATELLQLTQPRGKEATGIAVSFEDGNWAGLKMGVAATDFISRFGDSEKHYNKFVEGWRKKGNSRIVIGHCRKPSTGGGAGPEDNVNNHPIKVGETVGVHNGTLTNHEEIFKNLDCGRDGKVDSEAIFRLVNHYSKNGQEPFTKDMILEVCKRVHGACTCLTFNGNNPYQLAAFRDGRPLEIAIIKPLKLALLASEKDFLRHVIFAYNKQAYLFQASRRKFVQLSQGDVEFGSLLDKQLFLFDTNLDITAETKVSDVYESEKIPVTGKLWTKVTKVVGNTGNSWNGYNNGKTKTPRKEVNVNPKSAGGSDAPAGAGTPSKGKLGMVMNKNSHRFVSSDDLETSGKHNNVIVDVESGEAKDAVTGEDVTAKKKKVIALSSSNGPSEESSSPTRYELEETTMDLDGLITDPAKVNEIVVKSMGSALQKPAEDNVINIKSKRVVDMSVDSDALEKSIAAAKEDEAFSSDLDVVNGLEIASVHTLTQLPLYTLANKTRKWAYGRGWYAGYMAAKEAVQAESAPSESLSPTAVLKRYREKANAGTKVIKSLKILLRILGSLSGNANDVLIGHTTARVLSDIPTSVDLEALNKAIKATDVNNAPVIRKVLEQINEEETK